MHVDEKMKMKMLTYETAKQRRAEQSRESNRIYIIDYAVICTAIYHD
jgi:hypothetical protein